MIGDGGAEIRDVGVIPYATGFKMTLEDRVSIIILLMV